MTYKLNPEIGKIQSPVILIFPNGQRAEYASGAAVVEDTFDQMFVVEAVRAVMNTVEIKLAGQKIIDSTWIGEEQSFF